MGFEIRTIENNMYGY